MNGRHKVRVEFVPGAEAGKGRGVPAAAKRVPTSVVS